MTDATPKPLPSGAGVPAAAVQSGNPPMPTDASLGGPSPGTPPGTPRPTIPPLSPPRVDAPPPPPKKIKPKPWAVGVSLLIAAVGVTLILWAWRLGPFDTPVMVTDNGYVRGAITVLAPQVSGYVAEVLVNDFATVKAGQPLVRIDDRIYAEKVNQAAAQLDNAAALLANSTQSQAQNRATLASARASLAAAQAEEQRAANELKRVEELAQKGSVSLNERDKVRATAALDAANTLKAQAAILIAEETVKATSVGRAGLEAQVKLAAAQLALARIDLANTVVHAPRDGQISEASVRQGQYVTAGSQLLFLVPETVWVVANFKEGQTWQMRIGQPAHFAVDAFDGASLSGHVEQIAPATGSEFSVLRADNATGNFTKVVQRLPVRIAVDPGQPLARRLRPGMSVVVRVDTASGRREARDANAAREVAR